VRSWSIIEASNSRHGVESSAVPKPWVRRVHIGYTSGAAQDHPAPSSSKGEILSPEQFSAAIKHYQRWADRTLKAVARA
jgi:hypothetical protein